MKTTMDKSTLTRRQIEVLEAVFHRGNPWMQKAGPREQPHFYDIGMRGRAGGAISRMLDELQRRHYITTASVPAALTIKGLEALRDDKTAMRAITPAEIDSRIEKRKRIEADEKRSTEERDAERKANVEQRNAESRTTRLEKLRELIDGLARLDEMDDDELLAFAGKVADIETVY